MRNILLIIIFTLSYIVSASGQACDLDSSTISFENSDKSTLAIFLQNESFISINTTDSTAQQSALIIADSANVILNVSLADDTDCNQSYTLPGTLFSDQQDNDFYTIMEINFDTLETALSSGQSIDSLAGCFVLSNVLRVNDIKVNPLTALANVESSLDPDDLNMSGGAATLNNIIVSGTSRALDICLIDSLNRSINVFGDFGPDVTWVVTSRAGEIIDLLDTPSFNFSSYALMVESNQILHEIEIFHISRSGGDDWLSIGNNIKSDLCGSSTSNRSARFDIDFIECEDTCSDGFLNGEEIDLDVCMSDTTVVCTIIDLENVSCFGFDDGAATVEVTSGVGPFNYVWDTGDTTAIIENLMPGTYTVTVTSQAGASTECIAAINQPDSLEVNISLAFGVSCAASAIVTGGLDPYMHEWSNNETFITISNIDTLHSVTVTDRNGCIATATMSQEMFDNVCGSCTDGIMNGNETGIDCGGDCDPCPIDSLNMNPLQLTKTARFVDENDNGFAEVGETINYIFSVCNAGNVQLTQVSIDDPLITVTGGPIIIEAGACDGSSFAGVYTITESDLMTGTIMNQSTASGMLSDTMMVTDLSDDPDNQDNVDANNDGEPDDPTLSMLEQVGECGFDVVDTDGDGICDAIDEDDDGDGVNDQDDAFPFDAFETVDTDNDGFGNNADADDDNDGVGDRNDAFPLDATESVDTDGDGVGNVADDNDDGDACDDIVDSDPLVASDDCLLNLDCNVNAGNDSLIVFGGSIVTDIGTPVDSAIINITRVGENVRLLSDTTGSYNSSILPTLFNYQIRPEKRDQPFLGTSTLDMLFTQRHILRLDSLDTPYKVIAADVSGNQEVSIVDVIVMRRMILGIVDEWNDGVEWKFVDASASFFDPIRPWPFDRVIELSNAETSSCDNDFIGIKIGDVDNSFERSNTRTNDFEQLQYSMVVTDHGSRLFSFSLEHTRDLYGFQFSLADMGTSTAILNSGIIDISQDDYAVENGNLHISWTNPYGQEILSGETLFTIELANQVAEISFLDERMYPEVYVGKNIDAKQLVLQKLKLAQDSHFSISPNPFSDELYIQLQTETASAFKVNIFNASGLRVWELTDNIRKGTHQFDIPTSSLKTKGLYFYSLQINGQTHTGKVIRN